MATLLLCLLVFMSADCGASLGKVLSAKKDMYKLRPVLNLDHKKFEFNYLYVAKFRKTNIKKK